MEPDALLAGFSHFSIADSTAAAALLPPLLKRPDMTPALQGRLQRAAALGAAYARAPNAVAAFADWSPTERRSGAGMARARGPVGRRLRKGPGLDRRDAGKPRDAAALALLAGARGRRDFRRRRRRPSYAEIAGMRDYYGYLAADRLHESYNLNIHPSPNDAAVQTALASEPGMERAHALFDCDMADEAAAEWAQVVGPAKPAAKIQAARLASRWGWYAQAIATLAVAGEWDDVPLRYPRPYAASVETAAKETLVSEDWLYAIMRQESLFRKDAVSRADARGLMQMQPATAVAVARRWHLPPPPATSCSNPPWP